MSDNNEIAIDSQSSGEPTSRPIFRPWFVVPLMMALLIIALATLAILQPDGADSVTVQDSPALGKPAPQLNLVQLSDDLSGKQIQSVELGKVTLLHFWGTWCGPCRIEYPELSAMTRELETDRRFELVSVSCEMGPGETFEDLWTKTRDYFRSEGIEGEAFADPTGVTRRSLVERMERRSLYYPTSVLIDGEGKIAGVWEGYAPQNVGEIRTRADRLMARCD